MLSVNATAKLAKGVLLSSTFVAVMALSACGGGGGGGDTPTGVTSASADSTYESMLATSATDKPVSRQEAARFLTQATFGPTTTDIDRLMTIGYSAWLNEQASRPPLTSYKDYWERRDNQIRAAKPTSGAHINEINQAFWANAIVGSDQLRQRMAFALSEIFVISIQDGCAEPHLAGTASYMDMLTQKALGSYKEALKAVALHPVMGCFLSHLRNQKEDLITGRVPDENFAREIMQLFSIGLVQLNMDGTVKLGTNGQPMETYTGLDVSGLAKVFTGFSWDCPKYPSQSCFLWGAEQGQTYNDRWSRPMKLYDAFHSTDSKKFLGQTIPRNTGAQASFDQALTIISEHPNVAPFISKQLIMRLTTSNPSKEYVQRVAMEFKATNGNLLSVAKSILMDPEARAFPNNATNNNFGKVREPLLRLSAVLRAYGAESATYKSGGLNSDKGMFLIWNTNDAGKGLGQALLQAPSVFNYFRPGYTPPNTATSRAALNSPEMQILHETSAAGYVNYMRDGIWSGWGSCGPTNSCKTTTNPSGVLPDIQLNFQVNPTVISSKKPSEMVEDANQRLMYGTMPADLRADITEAVESLYVGSKSNPTVADTQETARRRAMLAIFLTSASPEFQVQR